MSALPQTETLLLEQEDGWLTVWLNRPEARNALSNEMAEELHAVAHSLADSRDIRGVTFRGKGGTFCAGGDLKGFRAITEGGQNQADVAAFSRRAGELFHAINELPQVTVMLVEGAAMAGGLGLVCAGDFVAVTADAKFALTETMLGIPPAQIAPLIVQRIGLAKARRIMLTAARFDGNEALALGIADAVVSTGEDFAALEAGLRKSVRLCAPGANAATKQLVLAAPHLTRDEMLDRAAEGFASCLLGEEGREGVASFLEKRKPRWAV
ncbi:MAG: enoyl-CoA hydratase/isomerase family protein [Neoaquamicrobium sediminum]|uniref:enoyl-CoA hydratase/isomerase family protein n=1 Tax=Neoaquamicrobium sediminum TaxID=1849104 RepID=UPI0040361AB9